MSSELHLGESVLEASSDALLRDIEALEVSGGFETFKEGGLETREVQRSPPTRARCNSPLRKGWGRGRTWPWFEGGKVLREGRGRCGRSGVKKSKREALLQTRYKRCATGALLRTPPGAEADSARRHSCAVLRVQHRTPHSTAKSLYVRRVLRYASFEPFAGGYGKPALGALGPVARTDLVGSPCSFPRQRSPFLSDKVIVEFNHERHLASLVPTIHHS